MDINADTKIVEVDFASPHPYVYYAKPFDFSKYKPTGKVDWEHEYVQTYKAEFRRYYDRDGHYLYTAALAPEINTVYVLAPKNTHYQLSSQHEGRVQPPEG